MVFINLNYLFIFIAFCYFISESLDNCKIFSMLIPFCFNSFLFPDSFFFMTLFINCLVSCTRFCIPVFPAQDVVFLYFLHKILYSCARCCILVFPVQDVVFLYFLYKMFCLISMLNGDSPNSLARGVNVSVLLYFINIVAYRVLLLNLQQVFFKPS